MRPTGSDPGGSVSEHLIRKLQEATGSSFEVARAALLKAAATKPMSFLDFLANTYVAFQISRTGFQRQLATRLERFYEEAEAGLSPRLLISMPPRHGKSFMASTYFPAYCLGRNPNLKMIHSSYTADLSNDFSAQIRALINSDEYQKCFPRTQIGKRGRLDKWEIEDASGVFVSVGVGGPLTGRGANIAIIDDPVKNAEEASSETFRAKQRDWYDTTLSTRIEGQGGILLIMTRWHEGDLGGYVLYGTGTNEAPAEAWDMFVLPALAEENDPIGRMPGDALWPEKFDVPRLDIMRRSMPDRWWQSLYQQNPISPTGNMLHTDQIKHCDSPPLGELKIFQAWDVAISTSATADYTVGATIGVDGDNNTYILDIVRERVGFNDTLNLMDRMAKIWRPAQIGIEVVAYQAAAFEEANRRFMHPFRAVKPEKDKAIRAKLLEARIDAGKVLVNKREAWWRDLEHEMRAFPNGSHDDQIDAVVMAMLCSFGGVWWEDKNLLGWLQVRQHGGAAKTPAHAA